MRFASIFTITSTLVAFGACAHETDRDGDELATDDPLPLPDEGGGDAPPLPTFDAFLSITAPDCDRTAVGFEVVTRSIDGVPPADVECELAFSDGSTASACAGVHELAEGGVYDAHVTVRDRATGAQLEFDQRFPVRAPIALESSASAPACGLEIAVDLAVENTTEVLTLIAPRENLVGFDTERRVYVVSAPGTYTVQILATDERTTGPICERSATHTVEVVACEDDHEHTGDCVH